MRLRQELSLPWDVIARVMVLNTTTVFGWAQRYGAEGEAGLVSKEPGRSCLSGRKFYPLIASKAKQEDSIIYWVDETTVGQDGRWVRGYAPAGQAPVLAATIQRFGLTMISAISSKGLVRFEFLEGAATNETTLGFMQRLVLDNEGHKAFLILDNIRAHNAKEVAAWVQAHEREIKVLYLPP